MMLSSVILWSLTAILGICSLILLSGHGAALIAGYNTMTEDEKKAIDEKKLCFVAVIGTLIIALVLFFIALLGPYIPNTTVIIAGSIFAIVAVVMVYIANTKCKK